MRVLRSEEVSPVKIDKKDKEILSLLCKNVRLPRSKIGHIIKLSRESVDYRIGRLEQAHVLAGSRTVINIRKLNNYSFHAFISLHNPTDEEKFIKQLLEDKDVNAVIKYSGKWDFEISIMAETPEHFYQVFNKVTQQVHIQDYSILILLNMIKGMVLPKKFLSDIPEFSLKKNDFSFHKEFEKKKSGTYRIDDKDISLMKLLSNDADIKIKDLAKRIKLSPDAITYRIKKLIENNYIIEFRPVIDYASLNLSIQALLIKTESLTPEQEKKFFAFLKENDHVLWATKTLGAWNILIYVITQSQKEFHTFIHDLRVHFGPLMKTYEALFAFQEFKYSFMAEGIDVTKK